MFIGIPVFNGFILFENAVFKGEQKTSLGTAFLLGILTGVLYNDIKVKHYFILKETCALHNGKGEENMNTIELLDKLQRQAMNDEKLRKELLRTRQAENPLGEFCRKCRELGYEIYEMELVTAGEEFYAEMKRSTNGGGENSPKLEGEDDFYEMFLASMEEEEEYEQNKKK